MMEQPVIMKESCSSLQSIFTVQPPCEAKNYIKLLFALPVLGVAGKSFFVECKEYNTPSIPI